MTPPRLDLDDLARLVTGWDGVFDFGTDDDDADVLTFRPRACIEGRCECAPVCAANVAEFDLAHESIASMLNAIPALVAEVRRLEADRDSYANSDFERQLSDARAELAAELAAERDALARERAEVEGLTAEVEGLTAERDHYRETATWLLAAGAWRGKEAP